MIKLPDPVVTSTTGTGGDGRTKEDMEVIGSYHDALFEKNKVFEGREDNLLRGLKVISFEEMIDNTICLL